MVFAQRREMDRMRDQGIVPKHQVLDNEILSAYRKDISATHINLQLVPPDDHRHNLAEKAINNWKVHFIGFMRRTAANFSIHLWCQDITQAERQLLLLRQSNVNPNISAYAQIYGPHYYNTAPFVPIGMKTLLHYKQNSRGTFAEHCRKGCVLGTAFRHYLSWKMWMKDTRATQISVTVFHKHKYIANPGVTPEERVMATAGKLVADIKGRIVIQLREMALQQLERLGTILKQ